MPARTITVIGSTNVDMIARLDHLPAVGESVTGGTFLQTYGGKGANQAVAAARAGGDVSFITCLGDDQYAPQIIQNFRNDGIDTSGVIKRKEAHTGVALVLVDQQGRNSIAIASGANFAITAADIVHEIDCIREAAIIVMQNEISPEAAIRAIEIAHSARIPVMFNYAPVSGAPVPVSAKMNMLVVNETEASQLAGMDVIGVDGARDAAYQLHEMGPAVVIVTLGPDGSYVVHQNHGYHVPAYQVKVIDTTAAGDTFCGALAVAIIEEMSLEHAVRFATAASAISVTRMGAWPSIPKRQEIDALVEKMQEAGPTPA